MNADLPMLPARPTRRPWGLMMIVSCDKPGCEREFWKLLTEYIRKPKSYCCLEHALFVISKIVDKSSPMMRERIKHGQTKVPKKVRIERSSKGGAARARNLTKERLSEIGLAGVAGLLKRYPPEDRDKRVKTQWAKRNFKRSGKLKKGCWAYIVSPGLKMRSVDDANHHR